MTRLPETDRGRRVNAKSRAYAHCEGLIGGDGDTDRALEPSPGGRYRSHIGSAHTNIEVELLKGLTTLSAVMRCSGSWPMSVNTLARSIELGGCGHFGACLRDLRRKSGDGGVHGLYKVT